MGELFSHFGVDWKLLLAQAVNFFILLFLLKKFAYTPILNVLRKRKEEIEGGLKMSAESKERLENIKILQDQKMSEAEKKAFEMVSAAETTAQNKADGIMQEAKKKSDAMQTSAEKAIVQERSKMSDEVSREAESLVRMSLEKVIGKMEWKERDETLIKEAMQELKSAAKV